jgi:two-component system cell cycle sensor histidine kinase/response regulator CckA
MDCDFFRNMLDALDDLVFVKDRKHRWVFLNMSCCNFWRLPREELLGKTDYDLFPQEQSRVYWEKDEEVFETGRPVLNIEPQTIDGRVYTIATKKSLYTDPHTGDDYIVGTIRDITDVEKAREALAESEQKFRNLAESSPNMIFINKNGRVVYVNKKCVDVMGYSKESFLSQDFRFMDIIHPEYHVCIQEAFQKHLKGEEISPYDYALVTRDGERIEAIITTVLIDYEGERAILGIVTDISAHKMIENALRASEERYRNLVELAPDGIVTLDKKGHVLSVNRAMLGIGGYSQKDFVGKHFSELNSLFPVDIPEYARFFTSILSGKKIRSIQYPVRRKDDSEGWVEACVGPLKQSGEITGVLAIVRDISERREIEEEIKRSELRYRATINSLDDFVHMVDESLNFVLVNEKVRRINKEHGIAKDVEGKNLRDVYPFLSEEVFSQYARVFQTGELISTEETVEIGNKKFITQTKKIPVVVGKKVANVVTVIHDVTEQKHTEKKIRESELQYRTLFDNSSDAIFIRNTEGKFLEANIPALQRLGYSKEELLRMTPQDLIDPGHFGGSADPWSGVGMDKGRIFETVLLCKDETKIPVEINTKPIEYKGNKAVLWVSRDISERIKTQRALKESEELLLHSQKMEAIGRLAGGIAHDFNNLLTAILGYSDILALSSTLGEEETDCVEEIKKSAERAALLTKRLLAFSRKQMLQPKIVDLNTLIKNLESLLKRVIGEDIDFRTELSSTEEVVKADPGQLEQVLINLIVNSRDAMPNGGTITVETGHVCMKQNRCHLGHTVPSGEYVYFTVRDTGTGIDEKISRMIFEPFFTTKEKGKGTGLGLATVYGIIHQSSGFIFLNSEPGKGTTFQIVFPMLQRENLQHDLHPTVVETQGGSESILVVEDEALVRKMIVSSLGKLGYTVYEAQSGEDAVKKSAHENPGRVDMLITDIIMPGINGRELALKLKKVSAKLKVLYISGYAGDAIGQHGDFIEDLLFLQKPFTPNELARKVRQIFDST